MIKFFLGIVVGVCLLGAGVYLLITGGAVSMATSGKPFPMERKLAHQAINASIGVHDQDTALVEADETNLLAGAQSYLANGCTNCHGQPNKSEASMGKRLYPHAPALFPPSKGVTDDPVGTTHWVVKNGIRFSGMPSFEGTLTDPQIWQVSQLLRNANQLPASVQATLGK
ncbi:MAG: c-type cytochrome [Chthoniobacterales bacterium]